MSHDLLDGGDGPDILEGQGNDDTLLGGAGSDQLVGGNGWDSLVGGPGDDTLTGDGQQGKFPGATDGPDTLRGGLGNDVLEGDSGNDSLFGDAGADTLNGGDGVDLAGYTTSPAGVDIRLHLGTASGGDAQGDVLSLIEDLEGSAHGDRLDGDGGDNAISGGAGSDTLRGEAGDDLLSGGGDGDHVTGNLGDDTLAGGGGADTLAGGGGRDLADYAASPSGVDVRLWAGTGSGGDAAGDVLTGIEDLLGSPFTDRLEGGVEANEMRGGSGDDTLRGANGDDLLAGGTGADELRGGAGDDTLIGGAGADALYGGGETDMADYSASPVGVDVRLFTGTGAGGDAAGDSLTGIENLVGSVHADRLDGDGGANAISGGTGSDSLRGDQGDDHLSGGAGGDTLNGGVGNDFASYATSPLGVKIDLRDGTVSGGDAQGDVLSLIENLEGSAHRDTLFGDSGGNMIEGGGGDDILVGMEGDDTLRGGAGPDNLTGNSGADTFFYLDLSDGTIITANETVAASELFRDRVMDFVSGTDDFALDSPNFDAAAAFDTIAQAYDGTNSNVSSGSAVIFDGSHLIYDPDVNTAGYTVIAEVQGDAVVATDIVFV